MNRAQADSTPLLVFSDDWGRHPSSCQHLIARLAPHRRVLWVNTIGTRTLVLDKHNLKRGLQKLVHWFGPRGVHPGRGSGFDPGLLTVTSPIMWPSFRGQGARTLNRLLLVRALEPLIRRLDRPPIVVTTVPIVADLVGRLEARAWIYYCVDDFAVWSGYDGSTLAALEHELVMKVDRIVAVNDPQVDRMAKLGRSADLLSHGVDLELWRGSARHSPRDQRSAESALEFAGLAPPFVVSWGAIDRRLDLDMLRHLDRAMNEGSIVLFGPQENPDPNLFRLSRVHVRPPVSFERLPAIAASSRVLIMPYLNNSATKMLEPLKLKEYLATGLAVVASHLRATEIWSDACDLCESPPSFAARVVERITSDVPQAQHVARERLSQESWSAKAEQFEHWLNCADSVGRR